MTTNDGTRHILLVDDDADVRKALRLLFEMDAFHVDEAANGTEAVVAAGGSAPDLVILDDRMPGLSGGETAALLRRVVPGAIIVAFSAHLGEKPAWADAYLSKEHILDLRPLIECLVTGDPAPSPA